MSVQDSLVLATVILMGLGAVGGLGAWLFSIGQKLGKIVNATETTAVEITKLTAQVEVIEANQFEHSRALHELRYDVNDLQKHVGMHKT